MKMRYEASPAGGRRSHRVRRIHLLLILATLAPVVVVPSPAAARPTISLSWSHSAFVDPSTGLTVRRCEVHAGLAEHAVPFVAALLAENHEPVPRLVISLPAGHRGGSVIFDRRSTPRPPGDVTVFTFEDFDGDQLQDAGEPGLARSYLPAACEPTRRAHCVGDAWQQFAFFSFETRRACRRHAASKRRELRGRCRSGGWRTFGMFTSRRDCLRFFASHDGQRPATATAQTASGGAGTTAPTAPGGPNPARRAGFR